MATSDIDVLAGLTPPLDDRRFRWSVGTRPIPLSQWLRPQDSNEQTLAYKQRLISNQHHGGHAPVVVSDPRGDDAASELLWEVRDWLLTYSPDYYQAVNRRAAATAHPVAPIELVGQLVAEDFVVMLPSGNTWILAAASVCFPSRWDLGKLLGADLAGIHEAVPGYQSRLGAAVEAIFGRLAGQDTVLSRSNWTLLDTAERHLPIAADIPPRTGPDTEAAALADLRWLRIERQTLRALPKSGAVVFTILTPVHDVATLSADDQSRLLRAVASAPPEVRTYKGWPNG